MSEELFTIQTAGGEVRLDHDGDLFTLNGIPLTLDEVRALHSKLGEVLWDAAAGRFGERAEKWKAMKLPPGREGN